MKGVSLKRKLISIARVANTGLHNLLRNAWLTTAAVAVMTVTITIVVSAIIANYALQEAIEVASRELTVSIFIKDEAPDELELQLSEELNNSSFVESVYYKSKQEALTDFQQSVAGNKDLLAGLELSEGNPLPASFEVFMNDINEYENIIGIADMEQYEDVVLRTNDNPKSREAFNGFINAQDRINGASLVLGVVFGAISILVIFNTIRMAIFTRSAEIQIMKLIGATPNYIRGPYLFEAMMYGLVAGIVSLSVVYAVTLPFARRFLEEEISQSQIVFDGPFPEGVVVYFTQNWPLVFLVTILGGMLLGFFSSSVAMAKYLRLRKW